MIRLAGRDPLALDAAEVAGRPLHARTAVVMAVYNEDPEHVEAGLDAVWSSLAREPEQRWFDLFIMSDTTDAQIAAAEEAMWRRFVARYRGAERIFYRRRTDRSEHKAGNIADFVKRWGGELRVHGGARRRQRHDRRRHSSRWRACMEAHAEIGILQTLPLPAGRETLFGRLIQFGSLGAEPDAHQRARVLACRREQLLGSQRHRARPAVRTSLRAAAPLGQAAARRQHPQPRFRRGGVHAPGRFRGVA